MEDDAVTTFEPLVTAAEAYPAFERLVLGARTEVIASFRIFDAATKLLSLEGRALGEDWADLLADALGRRLRVRLILADFDPVMAAPSSMMRGTEAITRSIRGAARITARAIPIIPAAQVNMGALRGPVPPGLTSL